jgi:hypothetical protein
MACAKNTPELDNYISNYLLNNTKSSNCRKYKSFYPSFTPTINSLFKTNSVAGDYSNVMINGSNFLPPCYGSTYVNFGLFKNLPIVFYSTSNASFIVPLNAIPGSYNVQVVNIYNGNFSPSVNQSYAGTSNFSNSITYTLV